MHLVASVRLPPLMAVYNQWAYVDSCTDVVDHTHNLMYSAYTWFRCTFCEYKTYSGLKALEVILKNLGFVCSY